MLKVVIYKGMRRSTRPPCKLLLSKRVNKGDRKNRDRDIHHENVNFTVVQGRTKIAYNTHVVWTTLKSQPDEVLGSSFSPGLSIKLQLLTMFGIFHLKHGTLSPRVTAPSMAVAVRMTEPVNLLAGRGKGEGALTACDSLVKASLTNYIRGDFKQTFLRAKHTKLCFDNFKSTTIRVDTSVQSSSVTNGFRHISLSCRKPARHGRHGENCSKIISTEGKQSCCSETARYIAHEHRIQRQ